MVELNPSSQRIPHVLWWILQLTGVALNGYYLYHMIMLNVWFGHGITVYAIWKQLLFLTNINHLLVFLYHAVSLSKALKNINVKREDKVNKSITHNSFNTYQFMVSLGILVSASYWILRSIDVRLVHGKHTPDELGANYTMFIHGGNLILLLIEVLLCNKRASSSSRIRDFTVFMVCYTLLLLCQKLIFNRDVYGFQRGLGIFGSLLFLLGIPVLVIIDKKITQKILGTSSLQADSNIKSKAK